MKTNPNDNPAVVKHWQNMLIEAIDSLKVSHDLPRLAEIFTQFAHLSNRPECVEDFSKEDILDSATECIDLLGRLCKVYECHSELKRIRSNE